MQIFTFSMDFKDDTRTFSFPDFSTQSNYQCLDISEHDTAFRWANKDAFLRATVPNFHVRQSSILS